MPPDPEKVFIIHPHSFAKLREAAMISGTGHWGGARVVCQLCGGTLLDSHICKIVKDGFVEFTAAERMRNALLDDAPW